MLSAIGIGIAYSFYSDSDVPATAFDWIVSAVITVIWIVAARNARSTFGRVILWFIVFLQAAGWVFFLGVFLAANP